LNILELRALRGPNYWSRYLTIYMRLDIAELEDKPSDKVPGIVERLLELIPSLHEHRCSVGKPGGFLERVKRGTYAGHVVEHVAIELQNLIGFSVGYGKTVDTYEPGVYHVVYRYRDESCGLAAGREAVDFVERLFNGGEIDMDAIIARLKEVRDAHMLGPSTGSIVNAAKARDIPYMRLSDESSYIQLGHGHKQQRFQATVTWNSSLIGYGIADDKDWTKQILGDAGIPVPRGQICHSFEEAVEAANWIGYPVATKPLVGNHGRGVSTDINDEAGLREGYDGKHTLQQLVDIENEDPRRGVGHENLLTQIHLDEQSFRLIHQQGLTVETVIPTDQIVWLKSTANLSTGGTATDVTDDVHPDVHYAAERIARLIGLDIIGIDLLAETLTKPLEEQSAGVVEVNAGPGFRMHMSPTHGEGRDVGKAVVDMLYPDPADNGRIPITAITGTNGKTTTVRLLSHLLRQAGRRVGMACTGAIEIDNHVVMRGDYSGPQAASIVLKEPTVEHAVLEVARGGIMRRGLGFDECEVGVLLNIASDHLGERDIHTLDELARCKTVVIDACRRGGISVINADDERCLEGAEWARGDIIYFTMDPDSRPVRQHVREHGVAFTVHNEKIVMRQGQVEADIIAVSDAPITFDGHARFNVANALAAAAAAYGLGLNAGEIQMGLQTFHPTPGQNPGRTNLIEADGVKVLIDYGHNVPALEALDSLVSSLPAKKRICVASAPGNRRDEDIEALGNQLARMHDALFICETHPRGRELGEAAGIVRRGAEAEGSAAVEIVMNESEAVEKALDQASEGDLLVLLVDDLEGATRRVKSRSFRGPAIAAGG